MLDLVGNPEDWFSHNEAAHFLRGKASSETVMQAKESENNGKDNSKSWHDWDVADLIVYSGHLILYVSNHVLQLSGSQSIGRFCKGWCICN